MYCEDNWYRNCIGKRYMYMYMCIYINIYILHLLPWNPNLPICSRGKMPRRCVSRVGNKNIKVIVLSEHISQKEHKISEPRIAVTNLFLRARTLRLFFFYYFLSMQSRLLLRYDNDIYNTVMFIAITLRYSRRFNNYIKMNSSIFIRD